MEERHETSKSEERTHMEQEKSTGLGLGLDVDINLRLGELRNVVDMLTSALEETGETATDLIAGAVRKIREAGPENFKGFKGQEGEAGSLYDRTVSQLRQASDRGEEEARDMLNRLGEGVESTGQKMQEKSGHTEGGTESTHH